MVSCGWVVGRVLVVLWCVWLVVGSVGGMVSFCVYSWWCVSCWCVGFLVPLVVCVSGCWCFQVVCWLLVVFGVGVVFSSGSAKHLHIKQIIPQKVLKKLN